MGEELHELFYTSAGWQSALCENITRLVQLVYHEQNFALAQGILCSVFTHVIVYLYRIFDHSSSIFRLVWRSMHRLLIL